jgi:hypothetical protein
MLSFFQDLSLIALKNTSCVFFSLFIREVSFLHLNSQDKDVDWYELFIGSDNDTIFHSQEGHFINYLTCLASFFSSFFFQKIYVKSRENLTCSCPIILNI